MVDPLAGMPIRLMDVKPSPLFPKDPLDHWKLMERYRYIGLPRRSSNGVREELEGDFEE